MIDGDVNAQAYASQLEGMAKQAPPRGPALDEALEKIKELAARLDQQVSVVGIATDRLLGENPQKDATNTMRPIRAGKVGSLLDGIDDVRDLIARLQVVSSRLAEIG